MEKSEKRAVIKYFHIKGKLPKKIREKRDIEPKVQRSRLTSAKEIQAKIISRQGYRIWDRKGVSISDYYQRGQTSAGRRYADQFRGLNRNIKENGRGKPRARGYKTFFQAQLSRE